MTTPQTARLLSVAQSIADVLPASAEEAIVTGSVSRGVADDLSDIEMLIVTATQLTLDECFAHAAACGLTGLGTWGPQGGPASRVSGARDGVPIELIWWSREHAENAVDRIFAGDASGTAEALANGVALRTSGRAAQWQTRLADYPAELTASHVEDAALKWGGFHATGLLTLLRPGARLTTLEWLVDDASRLVRIVFAVNRVWQPTSKRLADRVASLERKPIRFVERIDEALGEPNARSALLTMIDLQLDTLALAPSGPYVERAQAWLAEGREALRQARSL